MLQDNLKDILECLGLLLGGRSMNEVIFEKMRESDISRIMLRLKKTISNYGFSDINSII